MERDLFNAFDDDNDDDNLIREKKSLKKKKRDREENSVSNPTDRLGTKKQKIK